MSRVHTTGLLPLRPRGALAGACLVLVLAASCGGRKTAEEKSGPQQDIEILFRRMQAAWNQIFTTDGAGEYRMARLEFFQGEKETPCGKVSGGIHYCAENWMVSIGRGWLEGAGRQQPGVQAYLLARTLARHVQRQLGVDERVERAAAASPREKDDLLRKRELQVDCLVGLWRRYYEQAEPAAAALREAMRAAGPQGGEGPALPPLEERLRWFDRGLAADEIAACNVFAEPGK